MDKVSQVEFLQWQENRVTREFYQNIKDEISHQRNDLENLTKFDIGNMSWKIGIIHICQKLLTWIPEWEIEDE